jgi:hypothetical protein
MNAGKNTTTSKFGIIKTPKMGTFWVKISSKNARPDQFEKRSKKGLYEI